MENKELETNFRFGTVYALSEQVESASERVQVKKVFENKHGGVVLLAFRAGQKLDTHIAPYEVMVNVVEGDVDFTMNDVRNNLKKGDFMLMGANVPHSVEAKTDAKLMLVKIEA